MKIAFKAALGLIFVTTAYGQPSGVEISERSEDTRVPEGTALANEARTIFQQVSLRLADLGPVIDLPDHVVVLEEMHSAMIDAGQAFFSVSPDLPPSDRALFHACGHFLTDAGLALYAGDRDGVVDQAEQFLNALEDLLLRLAATDHVLAQIRQKIGGFIAIAQLNAPSFWLSDSLSLISEALSLSNSRPAELQAMADALLAIDDPEVRDWLSLDDPEVAQNLADLAANNQSPEMHEWRTTVTDDPAGWLDVAITYGMSEQMLLVGESISTASKMVPPPAGCADECITHDDCAECYLCQSGVGTWGNNPDQLRKSRRAVNVLTRAPRMTPGAGKPVRKAFDSLVGILTNARPSFWIKVCYECCESRRCGFLWLRKKMKCIQHESGWIEVPGPFGGLWIGPLSERDKADLERRSEQEAANACQDPCS